jgi:hypothetical protein
MVDGHTLSGISVWIVFIGFIGGLALYSFSLYRLWQDGALELVEVRFAGYAIAAVFSLMLPMLSNESFSLLTYGDAANRGVDVYTDVASLHISPFSGVCQSPVAESSLCIWPGVSQYIAYRSADRSWAPVVCYGSV